MSRKRIWLLVAHCLTGAVLAHTAEAGPAPPPVPPPQSGNPVYTQDPNLNHFTSTVVAGNYATFIDGLLSQFCFPCIPPSTTLPYTPTTAILTAKNYPRVIGRDASPPIVVQFSKAVSKILVFNNVDHVGFAWDSLQYNIYGSNDGISFTLLFNPLSVKEFNTPGIDTPFTLATWQGVGPTLVNNTLTPGLHGFGGDIGYEEYFDFGKSAFQYYAFRTSSLALDTAGEVEQELSAVAEAAAAIPEPPMWSTMLIGVWILGFQLWRRQRGRFQASSPTILAD